MDPVVIGIVLGFGLLLIGSIAGIVIAVRKADRRETALALLATSLKFTAVAPEELVRGQRPGEAAVWDAAGAAFGLIKGNRGQVSNLFHSTRDGRDLWLFDFTYSRVPGSRSSRATVLSLGGRGTLPPFQMSPEGRLERLWASFGGSDIDFADHRTFSGLYALRADDETAVRTLFTAPVLDFFASHPGCSLSSAGDRLVFHSAPATDGRIRVEDVESFVRQSEDAAKRLGV